MRDAWNADDNAHECRAVGATERDRALRVRCGDQEAGEPGELTTRSSRPTWRSIDALHAARSLLRARVAPGHGAAPRRPSVPLDLDASGRAYMGFAVDVRRGAEWHENDVVGCGYTQTGALFVKRGDESRPEVLLGKEWAPLTTCVRRRKRGAETYERLWRCYSPLLPKKDPIASLKRTA